MYQFVGNRSRQTKSEFATSAVTIIITDSGTEMIVLATLEAKWWQRWRENVATAMPAPSPADELRSDSKSLVNNQEIFH
jgi:hypothetical protein